MIAGGLEVAVVRTLFLPAIDRISVLSISSTTRRGESMASALAINSRLSTASAARLSACVSTSVSNDCKTRGQRCTPLPDLTRANEPESRILREAHGVVDILIHQGLGDILSN
jgi:hypothetical protein